VTALLGSTSYTVDPWDPGYGVADELYGQESSAEVELDFELPAERWRPLDPAPDVDLPATTLFLDGVRRIDARVWVHNDEPEPVPGVVASLAVGLLRCDGTARIADIQVDRGLYTTAAEAVDLRTRHAAYALRPAHGGPDRLVLAVQQRLLELEVELAIRWRAEVEDDALLVVDGPLRGRTHLHRTVGYIKTHNKTYLPTPQAQVVADLGAGQRTPVFSMGTSWQRRSWYLRLPEASTGTPWSGIVRLECPVELSSADAARLADTTAALLPPLASRPHKDPRAPQNLVPIGGLERELRHRLGDPALLYRSLRAALHGG